MSSGGVGQLDAQRRERQGLSTSIVRHFDDVDIGQRCREVFEDCGSQGVVM